jgi:hypothetical protein
MLVTPESSSANGIIRLDLSGGRAREQTRSENFEWQVRRMKDRQSRRDLYEMTKRGYDTDPLVRAKLVTCECKADKDYTTMDTTFKLTKIGERAVQAVRQGLVFDTKLQQATFSATSEFYLEKLRAVAVSDRIMALAQKLPRRYKDVHKAILLRQLFSAQDAKGNWIKVDLS